MGLAENNELVQMERIMRDGDDQEAAGPHERIFLVTRVAFDNLENRHSEALVRQVLGYAKTPLKANLFIDSALAKEKPYRGWDGDTYPKFEVTPVAAIGLPVRKEEPCEIER